MNFDIHATLRARLPGWRLAASHSSEDAGELVTVQRFDEARRCLVERTVWVPRGGEPVDAHVDEPGYIVSSDGVKLA